MTRIDFQQIGYDAEGEPQYGLRETTTMNRVIHTTKKMPLLKEICDLVGYTKRIVHVIPTHEVQLLNSQWDGGTRVRYRAVNITNMDMVRLPDREGAHVSLTPALVVVAATVMDGKEQPLTIYMRPENVQARWTEVNPTDLTWEERVVLAAIKHFRREFRLAEVHNICALGEAEYKVAKARLMDRGLLSSKGAITLLGINAIGATTLRDLAAEKDPTPPHTEDK